MIIKELGQAAAVIDSFKNITLFDGQGILTATDITTLSAATQNLTQKQQAAILAMKGLNAEQITQVMTANGATDAEISLAMATTGLSQSIKEKTFAETQDIIIAQTGNAEKAKAIMQTLGLTAGEQGQLVVEQQLTREKILNAAAQQGLNNAQAQGIATSLGYSTVSTGLVTVLKGLGTMIKATAMELRALAVAHPIITLITAAVAVGIAAWKSYRDEQEEIREATEEATKREKERLKTQKQEITDLQSLTEEYEKLGKKTDLTADEKERLQELQEKLVTSYNAESKGIDLVNGKYDEEIQKLKELNKEKQKQYLNDSKNARYTAHQKVKNNEADLIVDETTAKAISKDFEDSYSKFVDAVFKKGIKGVTFDTSGNIQISDELNSEQKVKALTDIKNALNEVTDEAEKDTSGFTVLNDRINTLLEGYQEEVDEYNSLLKEEVELLFNTFSKNGIDINTVTQKTGLAWRDALKDEFAKDDPALRLAINKYYDDVVFPSFEANNKELSENAKFDWSEFYDEQGLEDVEKKLKSLKTAYKSLEENGELSKDEQASLLKDYPELLQYIDDPEKLKVAIKSSAREAISAAQLVLTNLYLAAKAGSTEEANLKKALGVLDDMADVTTKVKEETTKTSDLYKEQKKQIHENIQALNREIQSIDKQVDALEKKKDAQEEYVKQLEKEKDRLDDLIDKYERAADTVSDYIDEQIDGLEKQQGAIEKSYNDQIDALKEYYEEQSDLLSEQIKGLEFDSSSYDSQIDSIEKQIKAIQKQGDEQEKVNKLKEKELALEKAKEQLVRVYDATRGYGIEVDSDALAQAQKDLDDAVNEDNRQREIEALEAEKERLEAERDRERERIEAEKERLEKEKERLEKEREAKIKELERLRDNELDLLQAEIDKVKEYKTAWEEAVEAYKKAQDEMNAAAIFGSDWRQKVYDKDFEIIQNYGRDYESLQNQLNNVINPMIEQANKQIEVYDKQIEALKTQKQGYQDMLDAQKNYLDFFKTYADDLQTATTKQKKAWNDLSDAIGKFTDISGFDNLADYYDRAMALFNEDYIPTNPLNAMTADDNDKSLFQKLFENVVASKSVYDAIFQAMGVSETASKMFGDAAAAMTKATADVITNKDYSKQDISNIINVNNPVLSMTKDQFMSMLSNAFAQLDRDTQGGKR